MRIQAHRTSGSVVVVVLIVTVLIGVTLGSYLHLVANQNVSIMRSMAWNNAVAVAEAGIEDAMAHLNYNTTNRTFDGWTLVGTNVVKERFVGSSKYKTYVAATPLVATNDRPAIVSEGWVVNPNNGQFLPRPRVVRVSTTNDALFAKGLVAKGLIDLNGNNIKTDSYDSTIAAYNTGGRYDATKNKDNGDVATNSKLINVGNADIYGHTSTGPGGLVSLGANGTIGSKAWHANPANAGKAEPGWVKDDMNVQFPDVRNPYTGLGIVPINAALLPGGTVDGVTYDTIIPAGSGNYIINELSGNNKKVYVAGNATLLVTGDINMSGANAGITIATNASLNMYVAGTSAVVGGNGIMNKNGKAGAFSYWGLPSNKNISLKGNGEFAGTLYAPQAALTFEGSGATVYDFMGATVAGSVKMNGHFNFHYDESLGIWGPRRGYTIVSWSEADWSEM
jgi:hypothetical protein